LAQLRRPGRRRFVAVDAELRSGGFVDENEIAALVLDRDARGQHPEHIPQEAQFGFGRAPPIGFGRSAPQFIGGIARHGCKY